jgi:hypothetical protein
MVALPACVIGSALVILANNAGHLLPIHAGAVLIRWEDSLGGVLVLLPCWPRITLLGTIWLPRGEASSAHGYPTALPSLQHAARARGSTAARVS